MIEAKILDCPCCGKNPKLVQMTDSERPNATWIECGCGLMTDTVIGEPKEQAASLATEIWNGSRAVGKQPEAVQTPGL